MTKKSSPLPVDDPVQTTHVPLRFVARQPILTADQKIFGYELLFRDGVENFFNSSDPEAASHSVLDSSMMMGFDLLCDSTRGFINCTRDVLLKDYVTLLPSSETVVEILEDVPTDELVVAACHRLKKSGYLIALDDFIVEDPREILTDLADIIKVDLRLCSTEQSAALVKRYGKRCRMLAEKVETQEEFTSATALGFSYFRDIFLQAGNDAGNGDSHQPDHLCAHAAGRFAPGFGFARNRGLDQERAFRCATVCFAI